MKYVQQRKDDYDKSLKLNDQLCLCYSANKIKKIEKDKVKILGEVIKGKSKKEEKAKLSIENKLISVYEEGTFSKALYKRTAYIAVEESDGYIAVMENRLPFLIWIFGLIVIATVALVILMNTPKADTDQVEPYNALPPVDSNVEMIEDGTTQESTAPKGGGKVGIGYQNVATLNLSDKIIEMEYTNPKISSHDAVIEFCIISGKKEHRIAASGRIPAGAKLTKMALFSDVPKLSEGKYNARYKVCYYDSKTGEKALVSSDIDDITLVVKNK